MTLGELKEQSDELRRALVKLVFAKEQHDLPDLSVLRNAIAHRARMDAEIAELDRRSAELAAQQAELAEMEAEAASTGQVSADAQKSLEALHEPLGMAAFQAFLRGKLEDQPLFYERKTCGDKLVAMKKLHEELQSARGFLAKAKAKAQQAIIWGKIQIEESRAKNLNGKIGRELVQTSSVEMVSCDETTMILAQVAEADLKLQEAQEELQQVQSTIQAKKSELYTAFGSKDIYNSKALNRETQRCRNFVSERNRETAAMEKSLPDQLLGETRKVVLPSNSDFTNLINELRETEIRIATLSSQYE